MPPSRFARALQSYFGSHSQTEFAEASGVDRGLLSHITNGRRRPTQDAARDIISAMTGPDRIDLLRAWLEDQIPETCAGLVRIIATAQPAESPAPRTDEARALAWLQHQLDTNVHAVHAIVDLWQASGSPDVPDTQPAPVTGLYSEFLDPASTPEIRVAEGL